MIQRSRSHRHRLYRHAAIAGAAVAVLSAAIVLLALLRIDRDARAFIDGSRDTLAARAAGADLALRKLEQAALEAIPPLLEKPPADLDGALARLSEEHPLIREPFVAVHGALLWPRRPGASRSLTQALALGGAATPLERQLFDRVLELRRLEKPAEALLTLETLLGRQLQVAARAEALLMQANLLAADPARRNEAIRTLDELLALSTGETPAGADLEPWLAAAMLRKGALLGEAGRPEESAGAYLELADALMRGSLREAARPHADFYLDETIARLAALESGGAGSPAGREAIRERLRSAEALRRRRAFAEQLESFWLGEISRLPPGGDSARLRLFRRNEDGPQLLVLAREKGDPERLAGFQADMTVCCDRLLAGMEGLETTTAPRFRIIDAEGRPILGDAQDPASPAASGSGGKLELELAGDLGWKLQADFGPEIAGQRRRSALLYGGLAAAAIAIILTGAAAIVRGLRRESQLAELKSQFVANVSHELKTPLTIIRMFTDLLLLGYAGNPQEVESHLKIIARETEHLDLLIDNVLDISRIEAGEKLYHAAPERPAELVEGVLEGYRPYLARKGFSLRTSLPADLPSIQADRLAFSQALRNLLSNAVKYSDAAREIEVSLARQPGGVRLEVSDRGIGILPSEAERLFLRFYRSAERAPGNTGGAGIGLAIVKHIAEAHGGEVRAAPREGGGSVFTIVWLEAPAGGTSGPPQP